MNGNSNAESDYNEKISLLGRKRRECCLGCPQRWILVLLGFFGIFNVYAMRVNLNVTIVAMVKMQDRINSSGESIACLELLKIEPNRSSIFPESGSGFDWDASTQALILGSFFYGYVITQLPGGYFAEKYGAKWIFGAGSFITSVFTLLTPYAAFWGVWPLIIVRIIIGLGEGVAFPSMNSMIARWAPKNERSRMSTIIYAGAPMGIVISSAMSGIISDTIGWQYAFYVLGIVGIIWLVFWLVLVYEIPELHPCITEEEVNYIRLAKDSSELRKSRNVPWKVILTSPYVWALVITHFGENWGFFTLLTEMPTYLATILHFDMTKNGVLSAIPYLMEACLAVISSFIADKLRSNGRFRISTIRKWLNSIAFFGPALFIAVIAYVGCEPTVIIVLLAIAVGLNGLRHSGFSVTHVDMSPEFAGTLLGITSCIGNTSGFLAPAYVGFITQSGETLHNWRIVFLTTSVFFVVSGLVYIFFCTAELQPWSIEKLSVKKLIDEHSDSDKETEKVGFK